MKTIRIRYTALALLSAAMIFPAHAEKVRFERLPIELKDKIRLHSGSAKIEDVDLQRKSGKTTYQVAFKKDGEHTELLFNEEGKLLTPSGQNALDSRKIEYSEVPEVVQKIAETRLQGAEVNDVDRQVKDGEVTYGIGFKKNGQQHELLVSQEGRILNDRQAPELNVGAAAASASGSASERATLAQPVRLSGSKKVELTSAPEKVQKAIATRAEGARIEDFERGTWQGQNIYQAAFKDNGKHIEVQVRENGKLLYDPRHVGAAPAGSAGISWGSDSPYATVTRLVPLSSAQKVERNSLPPVVQRKLNTQVGSRKIEDIERGTWQGKTIYQVAFKDDNQQHVELQIDQQGNVVYDPRAKR